MSFIRPKSLFFAVAVIGLSAGSSTALAEPGSDDLKGILETSTETTVPEKRDYTESAQKQMKQAVKELSKAMEDAERDREAVRMNCLSKKLASAKTLSEVADAAQQAMEAAFKEAPNDDKAMERAEHEFRKVAVALNKSLQFAAEGEACLGESGSAEGVTSVDVTRGNLDDEDDTEPIDDGSSGLLGVDPPDTSPFE